MTRRTLFGLALLGVLTAGSVAGAATPAFVGPPAPPAADTQDLVFLAADRPVWLRLTVSVDGKTLKDRHEEFLRKVFDFLDRDGDGVLSKEEVERAPTPQGLAQMAGQQNYFYYRQPGTQNVKLAAVDTDEDGEVDFTEFVAYYRSADAQPFRMQSLGGGRVPAQTVNAALLKLLDADKDGKLSRAELEAAPGLLARFDIDDDECVSLAELAPNIYQQPRGRILQVPATRLGYAQPAGPSAFVTFLPGAVPANLVPTLMARYDKDKDGFLSRAESGLDAATFAALDTDKDGKLSKDELAKRFAGKPDGEIRVRLGKRRADCSAAFVPSGRRGLEGIRVRTDEAGRVTLEVGRQTVAMTALAADQQGAINLGFQKQNFLQFVRQADKGNKGYLDAKDVKDPRFVGYLQSLFEVADRDGDGKLTNKEIEAYFDLMAAGGNHSGIISTGVYEQSWFDMLDTDGDGRLSLRELRNAWKVLSATETDGKGHVVGSVPRQTIEMHLFQGQQIPAEAYRRLYAGMGVGVPAASGSARGPVWFRKMDRNGDGDVSPREFLGSPELFKLLDKDGDGLISVEEAEAADPRLIPGAVRPRK